MKKFLCCSFLQLETGYCQLFLSTGIRCWGLVSCVISSHLCRNPDTKTIEGDLLLALKNAGVIENDYYDKPQLMLFQRAARTDKGVSAVRQIVSLKLSEHFKLCNASPYIVSVCAILISCLFQERMLTLNLSTSICLLKLEWCA